jgi:hypothetical protein
LDGDQPISRLLPTQDNTHTEKMQTYVHASSGIQNHYPSVFELAKTFHASVDCVVTVIGKYIF